MPRPASALPWTHFNVRPDGRILAFSLDTCENCGAQIQAPNAIYIAEPRERLVSLGLAELEFLPLEGYYSDAIVGEACYTCNA